jgi:hypothetical protein
MHMRAHRVSALLLPRAEIQRARYGLLSLLHREEGIDLRLPRSRKDASLCGGMPPTPVSSV